MNVNYEKKPEMTLIGYHTEIRPEEGYQKCPEFWDKEFAAKYERLWKTMKPETKIEEAILKNGIGTFAIHIGRAVQPAHSHPMLPYFRALPVTDT